MKCGDLGFLTKRDTPCQQYIPKGTIPCLWHRRSVEERSLLATKGAMAAKMKAVLPASFPVPPLSNMNDVKAFVRELLDWVLKKPIERWRAAEARGLLGLFVSIEQVEATNKLADAVLTAQHGGLSLTYLNQFLETGAGKPLPSRVRALKAPSSDEGEGSV